MFKIEDGRDKFYQWDSNRKLIVEDNSITQVHFCNRTDDCSLVCETYTENGLNVVDVPNILLTTDWRIRAYAYDSNYTKYEKCFDVVSRTKPTDYIYTETEILNYSTLEKRVEALEEGGGSGNGVSKEYVDNSVNQVGAIATEANNKADTALSQVKNAGTIAIAASEAAISADNKAKSALTQVQSNTIAIGNIDNALDEIIAIQEALIGGNG